MKRKVVFLAVCAILVASAFWLHFTVQPAMSNVARGLSPSLLVDAAESAAQLPVVGGGGRNAEVWQGKERVNILLLGIDQRLDRTEPSRTDTMELFTLDPVNDTAGMLGIPRDMWVNIPGTPPLQTGPWEIGKINTANFYGDLYKYPGGGPALAKKTVEGLLGIKIQYVVRVNFAGFIKMIDSVGGIDVNVPAPIKDDQGPTISSDYGTTSIFFRAGLQHMNGETALEYVRTRHQDSDFGRMQRQQQVLLAFRKRALSLGMLSKLPGLLEDLKNTVYTDLSPGEILGLARLFSEVSSNNISTISIDPSCCVSDFWTADGEEALMPDQNAIRKLVGSFLSPAPTLKPISNAN